MSSERHHTQTMLQVYYTLCNNGCQPKMRFLFLKTWHFHKPWYNINEIRQTDRRLALKIHFEMTASFGQGRSFLSCYINNKCYYWNNKCEKQKQLAICNHQHRPPFKESEKCPLKKRANRPPFKVYLIPTVLYHYFTVFASKITPCILMTKRIKIISEKQPVKLDKQKIYAI